MSNKHIPDYSIGNGTPENSQSSSYLLDVPYRSPLNGHQDKHSPSSSIQGSESATLLRQKPSPAQQITSVTKVVREVHHLRPDGSDLDYGTSYPVDAHSIGGHHYPSHSHYSGYLDHMTPPEHGRHYNDPYHGSFQDYELYPPHVGGDYGTVYGSMNLGPGPYQQYGSPANYLDHSQYSERPPTPPTPSDRSESPPTQQLLAHDYTRKGTSYPQSGYDELDITHMIQRSDHFRITPSPGPGADRYDQMGSSWNIEDGPKSLHQGFKWRDPNFTEVISFLSNPDDEVKANAAAYLQHLCYMDDPNKQKTGALGGIPPLVKLLNHDSPLVYRNACGALRNLSYGRQNDENKRLIKMSGGIPLLINLLRRTPDPEVQELVTGILWNLSSCEDLKRSILDDGLSMLVNHIIIPHSGWNPVSGGSDTCWSIVFRNTSGVIRNISSAGEYARKRLRDCEGLIDSLFYVVRNAIDKSNIGNKSVENCVCILRNLSYRCQEVEDPNYDKNPVPPYNRVGANGENLGCFGASRRKRDGLQTREAVGLTRNVPTTEPITGMELLWQPEVVHSYLTLLQSCSNPETLEAAAGAIQNLAACYWQPSIEIRAAVRKEKGLPIFVELLRMEVDRVVCAVATALRNLAIDPRNKELIGKYAMRDLVQKLPSGTMPHDQGTSDDTIAAVLATLNEVIKKNAEFSRSLLEGGGVERLMNISKQRQKYTPRVLKFSSQVLFTMWQHQELREVYKKHGWKEQDFVTKTVAARNAGPNSPSNANSTLNRPMASQGGTRYEDRTMQRPQPIGESSTSRTSTAANYQMNEEIPMADMSYPEGSSYTPLPPPGGVCIFPPSLPLKPGEPLYAQVNREKKKNRQYEGVGASANSADNWMGYEDQSHDHQMPQNKGLVVDSKVHSGGDSWV